MTRYQVLRTIAFSIVVCLLLVFLCEVFENANTKNYDSRIYTYRQYPEDVIDAVFIGTSGVDRYWMSPKAYEDYGMTVYPLSVDGFPAWLYVDMIDYALKYQDPELIILDVRAFCQNNSADNMLVDADILVRRMLDALPRFSPDWFRLAFKAMDRIHQIDETKPRFDISLLLSFVRFHPEWQQAGPRYLSNSLGNRIHLYGGFYMMRSLTPVAVPQETYEYHAARRQLLDEYSMQALTETIAYVQDKGLQLLVVDTPQFQDEHEMLRANFIYNQLDEWGVDYVAYYQEGEAGPFTIDLDPETDFYNPGHVNYYGAEKFTDAFAAYLDENYDLPDRRQDPVASKYWNGSYGRILSEFEDFLANPYVPDPDADPLQEAE